MLGGIEPCSFIDFPGRVAAVLFLRGCNLQCRYCHNPQLIPRTGAGGGPDDGTLEFLQKRRGLLGGVVVTGGEPTLQARLPVLLEAVRSMGFAVKLDTNGTRPEVVGRLIAERLLEYAAVDVKIAPGPGSRWLCRRRPGNARAARRCRDPVRGAHDRSRRGARPGGSPGAGPETGRGRSPPLAPAAGRGHNRTGSLGAVAAPGPGDPFRRCGRGRLPGDHGARARGGPQAAGGALERARVRAAPVRARPSASPETLRPTGSAGLRFRLSA